MKKLLIVLSALTVFASCKKEDATTVPGPAQTSVVKNLVKYTSIYDNGIPEVSTYTYDAQGRMTMYKTNSRTTTFNYVSPTAMIATEKNNADNSLAGTRECVLNANGYITKIIFKNASATVVLTYDFIYNAEGYLVRKKAQYTSGTITEVEYTIADGNITTAKNYSDGVFRFKTEYFYDNSKLNKTPGNSGYWTSANLFGKVPKNVLVEVKSFNNTGALTWNTQTSFNMDAEGYPVSSITKNLLENKQTVEDYIFQ